jgi:hypothetical protein
MNNTLNDMLVGAIALASALAGLFFVRFWKSTRDRFFLYFAASFWIEGLSRLYVGATGATRENKPEYYLIRLVAYGLILWAIWEKNRPARKNRL